MLQTCSYFTDHYVNLIIASNNVGLPLLVQNLAFIHPRSTTLVYFIENWILKIYRIEELYYQQKVFQILISVMPQIDFLNISNNRLALWARALVKNLTRVPKLLAVFAAVCFQGILCYVNSLTQRNV